MNCHFCQLDQAKHLASNDLAYAVADGFPVSPGHTLVVTRRHVASWFETTADEQQAIMTLLQQLKLELDQQRHRNECPLDVVEQASAALFLPYGNAWVS